MRGEIDFGLVRRKKSITGAGKPKQTRPRARSIADIVGKTLLRDRINSWRKSSVDIVHGRGNFQAERKTSGWGKEFGLGERD